MRRFAVKVLIFILGIFLITFASWAEMKVVSYEGLDNCLEIGNGAARIVIAPAKGGRIVHYSQGNGANFFRGGHQVDLGPELDYPPPHPALWTGAYEAKVLDDFAVRLTSAEDEATGIQIVKEFRLDKSGAGLLVKHVMQNIGDKKVAYCFWDRTMTGAEYGLFPLNKKSRFPARWSIREGKTNEWSFNGASPATPRARIVDDLLVVQPGKQEAKVAADSMAGWMAGYRANDLFVKRFPTFPAGDYADGGNIVEIWVDSAGTRMEIEPLSPKVPLEPGESYTFYQMWDLLSVDVKIESAEDVPKLLPCVKKAAKLEKKHSAMKH